MKSIVFHPEAADEYIEAVHYYAQASAGLGRAFNEEMERTLAVVREYPSQYIQFESPARRAWLRRFPYAVVFVENKNEVWVLAIMHAKRAPGYWHGRGLEQ